MTRSSPILRASTGARPEKTAKLSTGTAASAASVPVDSPAACRSSGKTGGRLVIAARRLNETTRMPPVSSAPLLASPAGPGTARVAALPPALFTKRHGLRPGAQGPQHVLHDPAVPVVLSLTGRVDSHDGLELLAARADRHLTRRLARVQDLDSGDVEYLV